MTACVSPCRIKSASSFDFADQTLALMEANPGKTLLQFIPDGVLIIPVLLNSFLPSEPLKSLELPRHMLSMIPTTKDAIPATNNNTKAMKEVTN
jgi:hypothetical protein